MSENKNLNIKKILEITDGELLIGNLEYICENYSKDTRNIVKNDTYIGIKGDNFDGNIFWKEAIKKGASTVIVQDIKLNKEELFEKYGNNINIIIVKDTLNAIYEIAKEKRNLYDIPVIAITGSVGKTTTKDIIANVISKKYKTLKTKGNNNNNIGLPFTILSLKDEEAIVLEMGMNHLEEISLLSNIAKPTLGVIINVGTSHIGNLGSRENILRAKLEILDGMEEKNLIINNDNDMLKDFYEKNKFKYLKTYGIDSKSDKMAKNIKVFEEKCTFECKILGETQKIQIPVSGKHFILNSLAAILVGESLGITTNQILEGLNDFSISNKRMDIHNIGNNIKIINDAYNASLESMKASIDIVSNYKEYEKICVLGDMFELGEFSEKIHKDIGKYIADKKIDILLCAGKDSKYIANSAIECGMDKNNIYYKEKKEELLEVLKNTVNYDEKNKKYVIIFKASNGMKFYEIAEKFIKYEKEKGDI